MTTAWRVLGLPETATAAEIGAACTRPAKERHPDWAGGPHDMMADLNRARDAGPTERRGDDAA